MTGGSEPRHCRVCDEAALGERGVKAMAGEVFGPGALRRGGLLRRRGLADAAELRRRWGTAVSLRALAEWGVLGEETEVLAVGPGCDEAVRWLSLKTKRVFATVPVTAGELLRTPAVWSSRRCRPPSFATRTAAWTP